MDKLPLKSNNKLVKHSAAIHISNETTLLERKVYNILIKNASFSKGEKEHIIRIDEIIKYLGHVKIYKNYAFLEEAVIKLVNTSLTFNLLNKDRKRKWGGTIAMLAEAIPESGAIRYSFPPFLHKAFANPNIYANLDLDYQKFLSSKHSLALWEFSTEQLDSKKSNKVYTEIIPIETMKKLIGAKDGIYNEFKFLNTKAIKPSVKEVNQHTDIDLLVIYHKEGGRKITGVSFEISRKPINPLAQSEMFAREHDVVSFINNELETQDVLFTANELGLDRNFIEKLNTKHKFNDINKALNFVKEKIQQKNDIKNIAAYVVTILDNGFSEKISSDELIEESKSREIFEREAVIIRNDPKLTKFFLGVRGLYSQDIYRNWLLHLNFEKEDGNEVLFSVPTGFIESWIKANYINELQKLWNAINPAITELKLIVKEDL